MPPDCSSLGLPARADTPDLGSPALTRSSRPTRATHCTPAQARLANSRPPSPVQARRCCATHAIAAQADHPTHRPPEPNLPAPALACPDGPAHHLPVLPHPNPPDVPPHDDPHLNAPTSLTPPPSRRVAPVPARRPLPYHPSRTPNHAVPVPTSLAKPDRIAPTPTSPTRHPGPTRDVPRRLSAPLQAAANPSRRPVPARPFLVPTRADNPARVSPCLPLPTPTSLAHSCPPEPIPHRLAPPRPRQPTPHLTDFP